MFRFYETEGFALFPCNIDKTPRVSSWRATEHHIDATVAEQEAVKGRYIGAWLPTNYVVIDIDRGHKDGQDGGPEFTALCEKLGIDVPKTMTVRTGSGGEHLYFTTPPGTDHRTLSQKALCPAVDVRTHQGYVIAAGTNGYSVVSNDTTPIELPEPLLTLIQTRNKDRAENKPPEKPLPVEVLTKVLEKLPITEFDTNDIWQEFVTACIAVSGNDDEVLDVIEEWSKQDPNYKDDPQIRKRLESFEVSGGITAGTFIHVIKDHGVSKYLVDKVRMYVGKQFSLSERFSEGYEPPFKVDYSAPKKADVEQLYYQKAQRAAGDILAAATDGNLLYVTGERAFFYYDGNRWVEREGALQIVYAVLINVIQHFYTDHSKEQDADADEYLIACVNYLSSYTVLSRIESAMKQHSGIVRKAVDWDSTDLGATLTLGDCVMDFSDGKAVRFRPGRREEYRRLYIELSEEDFEDRGTPEQFRAFLKDVFPDDETRKTATYALATMLSGNGRFRTFQLWNGAGSNGKSTLMEVMKRVIGKRAITYKPEILLNKTHTQSLTPELAMFRGALVGFASETEESKRISQGQVKALTGNETIVANPKYKDVIEFATTFQIVLSTNYLPTFSAHDQAFIDRVLILPFYTCFYKTEEQKERAKRRGSRYFLPAKDPDELEQAIIAERAQILYYLARRYQNINGSTIPESEECQQAKGHYIEDNNDIFQFFEEFVEAGDGYFTPTKDLTTFYNEENNTKYSSKFVVMRLKESFPDAETTAKTVDGRFTRGIRGIRLKHGAYPEGWQGNYTQDELEQMKIDRGGF
jgi:P4 family phage/plasmid primase-like protien